ESGLRYALNSHSVSLRDHCSTPRPPAQIGASVSYRPSLRSWWIVIDGRRPWTLQGLFAGRRRRYESLVSRDSKRRLWPAVLVERGHASRCGPSSHGRSFRVKCALRNFVVKSIIYAWVDLWESMASR